MSNFRAVVADRESFSILGLLRRSRQLKARMHELAGRTLRAEACDVVGAEDSAHVTVPAVGAVPTEPSVVPAY